MSDATQSPQGGDIDRILKEIEEMEREIDRAAQAKVAAESVAEVPPVTGGPVQAAVATPQASSSPQPEVASEGAPSAATDPLLVVSPTASAAADAESRSAAEVQEDRVVETPPAPSLEAESLPSSVPSVPDTELAGAEATLEGGADDVEVTESEAPAALAPVRSLEFVRKEKPMKTSAPKANETTDTGLTLQVEGASQVQFSFQVDGVAVQLRCEAGVLTISTETGAEFRIPLTRSAS